MTIGQQFAAELEHEMAGTRRELERVPEARKDWTPHPKSMTLGRLAGHIVEMVGWLPATLGSAELDIAPGGVPAFTPLSLTTTADLLTTFDANVAAARAALAAAPDALFAEPWALKRNGQVAMQMPKGVVVRSMILNHVIHHRAQLGVYLRLLDVPLPKLYGNSADEA